MRCALFVIAGLASEACLARVPASPPVVAAKPLNVDFVDVAPDRCSPPIDGFVMSADAANDLVRGVRLIERDAEIAKIECKRDKDILDARNEAMRREMADAHAWGMVGRVGVGVVGTAAVITTIVLILKFAGGLQ